MESEPDGLMADDYSELWRAASKRNVLQRALWLADGERSVLQRAAAAEPGDGRYTAPGAPTGLSVPGEETAPARYFGSETFELVRNLFLTPTNSAPRSVMFCAVERGSECGWIAAQVAEILAGQAIGSVCVVDADLERPSLNTYFGAGNRPGFGEALFGTDHAKDFAKAEEPGGLWVVTAGALPPGVDKNGAEYRRRLEGRVVQLRESFDFLIVHAPPAHGSPITAYLAAKATGTVLILEPGITRQQPGRKAKERIEAAGGRVFGVVLHRPPPLTGSTES